MRTNPAFRPGIGTIVLIAVSIGVAVPAVPVSASHEGSLSRLDSLAPAMQAASDIRSAGAEGELAELLSTVMRSGSPAPIAEVTPGSRTELAASLLLSDAMAGPIAELAAATRRTTAVVTRAMEGAEVEIQRRTLRAIEGEGAAGHQVAIAGTDGVRMGLVRGAALMLTDALDRNLPLLRLAAGSEIVGGRSEGCDVLDALPALCVGGEAANTYTSDAALLVDLGGDDRYENSAGGAGGFPNSGGLAVSVNVDLAGDDVYEHEVGTGEFLASQGAAFYGVGILVDVAGNDSYLRRYQEQESVTHLQMAQGAGAAGVGMLADLAGSDSYAVRVPDDVISYYQGAGDGFGSTGVLFDAGEGNDDYNLDGGTIEVAPDGSAPTGRRSVYGQGFGVLGVGAVLDEGGNDSFTALGTIDTGDRFTSYDQLGDAWPTQAVIAQGVGELGGAGFVITGDGPTRYSVAASTTGLGLQFVYGQGVSSDGAVGVVDDLGGDDVYGLSSTMALTRKTGPGCDCEVIRAGVDASRLINPQNVAGQGNAGKYGFGNASAVGLLADHDGNDRYLVEEQALVVAEARAAAGMGAEAKAIAYSAGPLYVQGTAHHVGTGALVDEAGDDEYAVHLRQRAEALAIADPGAPAVALAEAQYLGVDSLLVAATLLAQGASGFDPSSGMLVDLGGADAYRVSVRSQAFADPTPERIVERHPSGSFQGSGPNSLFLDQDGGAQDTFSAEPNFDATCEGHRGEPTRWMECPDVRAQWLASTTHKRPLGVGFVDSAPMKDDTNITITGVQPSGSENVLLVGGSLTGPGSAPLEGRFVDVRLKATAPWSALGSGQLGASHELDLSATHAFTNADGSWSALLPLLGDTDGATIWAGFSGGETLRAATAQTS